MFQDIFNYTQNWFDFQGNWSVGWEDDSGGHALKGSLTMLIASPVILQIV